MRVLVTGASGLIGSAVVPELLSAGHSVVGLARSAVAADAVAATGAQVLPGSLEDVDGLRAAATVVDGVVHLAADPDGHRSARAAVVEARAIEALGAGLAGSGGPLVVAAALLGLAPGRPVTERDPAPAHRLGASPRVLGAAAALALAGRGVRASVVRFAPAVHDGARRGVVGELVGTARARGVSGYLGDGSQRWPALHLADAARLVRLAAEGAPAGSVLHGVAEEGVPLRVVAEEIGRHLGLPVAQVPAAHFGRLGGELAVDAPASSVLTQQLLGWRPTRPGLLADLGRWSTDLAAAR